MAENRVRDNLPLQDSLKAGSTEMLRKYCLEPFLSFPCSSSFLGLPDRDRQIPATGQPAFPSQIYLVPQASLGTLCKEGQEWCWKVARE